jgi:hypothetical protein
VLPVSFPVILLFDGEIAMFTFTLLWIVLIQYILFGFLIKLNRKKKWHLVGGSFLSLITVVISFYFYFILVLFEIRDGLFP